MFRELNSNKKEKNKNIRHTHCFHCKKNIDSQQWDTCDDCKGIVCSCGSCFCEWEFNSYDF